MFDEKNLTILLRRSDKIDRISEIVERANPKVVRYVSKEFLGKEWEICDLEKDLSSEAIEDILDEIRNCEYKRIADLYKKMKGVGLIKTIPK